MTEPTAGAGVLAGKRRRRAATIRRFSRVERAVHWCNAILFGILIFTGAALYYSPLIAVIGRRHLVESIHVYTGIALPIPVLLAISGRWGTELRRDLERINRWLPVDREWFRLWSREKAARQAMRQQLAMGKFNPGQKLNAAFTAGAALVMLGTGLILRWYRPFPLTIREGSTFVHDWLAVVIVIVIAGHIGMALADRHALRSMFSGRISRAWAQSHARGWLAEIDRDKD